jgi:hypothetical protein
LKTKGYNLEHNFGHGKQHLSAVLAILNLLAFAFHTVAELTHDLWLQAIERAGARRRFFEHCDPSRFTSSSPLGRTGSQPWHSLTRHRSRHDKSSK